jgi:hypothetical protein
MTKTNLSNITEQLSSMALGNNHLGGYNYTPHFRGKVQEIRSMGYNPISAVLEFIDNSLRKSCGSKSVILKLHPTIESPSYLDRISVLDDGCGMNFNQLCESFIFNLVKNRENGDIGKFHVGGKYAAISLAEELMILSKEIDGKISGLYADVRQMQENNSFAPTEICNNVTEEWACRKIPPALWKQFIDNSSGTLIHLPRLIANIRTDFNRHVNAFQKALAVSYTNLPNNCSLTLDFKDNTVVIPTVDLFYHNEEYKLDEPAYETRLHLYKNGPGNPARIIEESTSERKMPRKELKSGTPTKPKYFEYSPPTKEHPKTVSIKSLSANDLPPKEDLIDIIKVRLIQVSENVFKQEKKYFPEDSRLVQDRKGFHFNREVRNVGAGKQLNKKLGDRTSMAAERQRCLVTFSDKADEEIGSKFNKQMDDNALPNVNLDCALKEIYKQVTGPWTTKWLVKEKNNAQSNSDREEEQASESNDESTAASVEILSEQDSENDTSSVLSKSESSSKPKEKESNIIVVPSNNQESLTKDEKPSEEAGDSALQEIPGEEEVLVERSLNYDAAKNMVSYRTITNDHYKIPPPGNAHMLYEWLKSIPDPNKLDEIVEMLSSYYN